MSDPAFGTYRYLVLHEHDHICDGGEHKAACILAGGDSSDEALEAATEAARWMGWSAQGTRLLVVEVASVQVCDIEVRVSREAAGE